MNRRQDAVRTAARVPVAYRRDVPTWVAFGALFAFGILNAALGPALPYLRQAEQTSYLAGALHQVAFAVGGIAAGVQASRSTGPRRRVILLGLSGAAVAGLLLGYGRMFALTLAAALLIGAFATAALIRVWAVLADLHHRHRAVAMTEGEVAVSLAGIVTPALVSACAATVPGWRFTFVVAFVLVAAATVGVAATRLPDPARPHVPEPHAAGPVGRRRPAPRRTLATIFAVVGLEFTLSFWAASYLHDGIGVAQGAAVGLVSALYAAHLAGRVLASRLARRLSPAAVLRLSLVTALAGCPILLATGNPATATIGLVVTGIGIGGTFPLASSLHVAASGRTADQALGQILTVAGLGQIVGPLVAGALAQAADLRVGLLVMPVLIVLAVATTRPVGATWYRRRG